MKAYIIKRTWIVKVVLLCLSSIGVLWMMNASNAVVSNEYIANHEIQTDRQKILGLLVEIDAGSKVGDPLPVAKFAELNASFQNVFPKFPQLYTFKVVYQQCLTLSQGLTTYTNADYQNKMSSFLTNCYKPLSDILKQINTKYSVIANAKVSPGNGPAPLVVTLDARTSTDPSNDTIPSKNYYWYYRDTNGQDKAIGIGPVVNATFTEAGSYLVHLTVRSSNKSTEGIFDGEKTMSVDVSPKTANITVYANSQKVNKDIKTKISIQEAEKGVVFDGTATVPMGGRQILSHKRSLTAKEGFAFAKDGDGKPDIIRVVMPGQGEYKLTLTTKDNEGNAVSESYTLIVSDPVAIIKQTPDAGTTSTIFSFDAAASYSIVSVLKMYTRNIYDQNGNTIETYQGQSIKQNFKKPGAYTVKLTVQDKLGQVNVDSVQIFVESSDPIPQFTMTPSNTWKDPSEFVFDASLSSDIDKTNRFDTLSYERFLGDTSKARVVVAEQNNEKIRVQFDAVGKHSIKLVAKDDFGKQTEISKDLEIKSILRPEIYAIPIATQRGNPINFVVKSNQPIVNYIWDFGDGDTRTIQSEKISHVYKTAGVYTVTLKVSGANGSSNEVSKTVFVGEKGTPVGGYTVIDKFGNTLTQKETCLQNIGGNEIFTPAYQVDRYKDITIDPSISVNSKGQKSDLQFYYQPKNGEIYKNKSFVYKFDELGCSYVDLTIEDTSISKDATIRVRFKVINALPHLDNLVLAFPQYGNEVGIGFQENNVKDIFNDTFDPLIVKVTALNAIDPDGFISYFKRYYSYKDDPTRYLETKITPGNIPYAFFSLPRIPGEFTFGVIMYDNDDGKRNNEEIVGNGPLVFFPPDITKPDIPMVTLKTSHSVVEIGDEVQFDVISKVISDRPDFVQERAIQYDFDGDGVRDMITKSDRVKYVYTKPNEFGYRPRAAVLYRGYKGVGQAGNIIVRDSIKPMLLSDSFDRFAIFRDVSIGEIATKSICLDMKDCRAGSKYLTSTGYMFSTTYPRYDKYYISMDVSDKFANTASKKRALSLTTGQKTSAIHVLSIPQASTTSQGTEFFVGKNLNNSILFYVLYDIDQGTCYVDTDLSMDTDNDGNSENDKDFLCNTLRLQVYTPSYQSVKGRIYHTDSNNQLTSTDFSVSFLDIDTQMDTGTLAVYKEVLQLIASLPASASGSMADFQNLLIQLKDNMIDQTATKSNIVAVRDYREKNTLSLDEAQTRSLENIFTRLSDKSVIAAQGGNAYQQAKSEILEALPVNLRVDVDALFADLESAVSESDDLSQQDKRKAIIQSILDLIQKNVAAANQPVKETQIDQLDIDMIVLPNICKIMEFYTLVSPLCPNTTDVKIIEDTRVSGQSKTGWVKIVLWIVGIGAGIFVLLIIIFAIRAKIKQANEEDDDEIVPPPTTEPPQ